MTNNPDDKAAVDAYNKELSRHALMHDSEEPIAAYWYKMGFAAAEQHWRGKQVQDDLRAVREVKDGVRYGYVTKSTDICDAITSRIENDAEARRITERSNDEDNSNERARRG